MNVYTYFRRIGCNKEDVPTKNIPLFQWSLFQVKKANLSKEQNQQMANVIVESLQNDWDLDTQKYKEELLSKINIYKEERNNPFWMEVIDFPLIQCIFVLIFHHLYQGLLVPWASNEPMQWQVPIGWGLLLRVFGTYLIMKALLFYFSTSPDRSKLPFWIILSASFFVYLAVQYYSNQWDMDPWFSIPLWVWILYNVLLVGFSLFVFKRKEAEWKSTSF